jgi:hypothetical protein
MYQGVRSKVRIECHATAISCIHWASLSLS